MPRPDNQNQYRYGAYDYRTAAEDRQRDQADRDRRANEEAARHALEQTRRFQQEQQRQLERQRQQQARKARKASKPPAKGSKDWSTGWAVIGFFVGAGTVAGQVSSGEGAIVPIVIAGAVAAFVAGRFYKVLLGLAAVVFVLWLIAEAGN